MNKKYEKKLWIILSFFVLLAMLSAALDWIIPSEFSRFRDSASKTCFLYSVQEKPIEATQAIAAGDKEIPVSTISADARLFGVIPVKEVTVNVYDTLKVYPGGMPFGVKLYTDGLVVVGFADIDCEQGSKTPAYDAGIRIHDIITKVDGSDITSAEEFVSQIEDSPGKIEVTYTRDGEEHTAQITPSVSRTDGKYKTGMWVRDSTAGIGTVTMIMPDSNLFVGLGHGICDTETGDLLPLMRGIIGNVKISGIHRGEAGAPGELKGYFTENKVGILLKNTEAGVLGLLDQKPVDQIPGEAMPIGLRDDIHEGKAHIWCTLDEGCPQKYEIEISNIHSPSNGNNFEIAVTDETLIQKTGGIVQGMSGSPIIQDGKLVGAVTHVIINNPLRGYGIFIEKMLEIVD